MHKKLITHTLHSLPIVNVARQIIWEDYRLEKNVDYCAKSILFVVYYRKCGGKDGNNSVRTRNIQKLIRKLQLFIENNKNIIFKLFVLEI